MKLGTLLLGTAAGLMVASAAQAADLPGEPVPAAVDYVKVCDTYGAGFFYIPGTETCLDISGRVRFRVEYHDDAGAADQVDFQADGRLQFDARNSSEYGTVRSFFQISDGLGGLVDDNGVEIDLAFIQIGYLTVGLQGDIANGDVLYGDESFAYFTGDNDLLGISVLVDDLGGGFYVGAGVFSGAGGTNNAVWVDGLDTDMEFHAAVGMAGQPWGSIDLSAVYGTDFVGPDYWSIKATADLTLAEGFDARLVAAYGDADVPDAEVITLAAAAYVGVSDAASVYAGMYYDIQDGDDDFGINAGVDYTVASGLVLTGEVAYQDTGAGDSVFGLLQLSRTW